MFIHLSVFKALFFFLDYSLSIDSILLNPLVSWIHEFRDLPLFLFPGGKNSKFFFFHSSYVNQKLTSYAI